MITPSSSSSGATPPSTPSVRPRPAADTTQPAGEALSTDQANTLRSELERQPEIRPDVVERAAKLAVDASYPPRQIIENVARLIAQSRDLSETTDDSV